MNHPFHVIIPARFASSRLPGKMLADIAGKPMIQHVYERALQSAASQVVVATDDEGILKAVSAFGGKALMTKSDHQSGTDRLQEAASLLELEDEAIVVNVQGDEPLIPPAVINQVAANLAADSSASVATLCEPIDDLKTFRDPNAVKVVADAHQRALYFSRAPIPWPRESWPREAFAQDEPTSPELSIASRHIGIYAYRVKLLHEFVQWPLAPLEDIEKLEQLRVLWQGRIIHVEEAREPVPGGVDTAEDLNRLRRILEP